MHTSTTRQGNFSLFLVACIFKRFVSISRRSSRRRSRRSLGCHQFPLHTVYPRAIIDGRRPAVAWVIVSNQLVIIAFILVVVSIARAVAMRIMVIQSTRIHLLYNTVRKAEQRRGGGRIGRVNDLTLLLRRQLGPEAILGQRANGTVGVYGGQRVRRTG